MRFLRSSYPTLQCTPPQGPHKLEHFPRTVVHLPIPSLRHFSYCRRISFIFFLHEHLRDLTLTTPPFRPYLPGRSVLFLFSIDGFFLLIPQKFDPMSPGYQRLTEMNVGFRCPSALAPLATFSPIPIVRNVPPSSLHLPPPLPEFFYQRFPESPLSATGRAPPPKLFTRYLSFHEGPYGPLISGGAPPCETTLDSFLLFTVQTVQTIIFLIRMIPFFLSPIDEVHSPDFFKSQRSFYRPLPPLPKVTR